MIYIVDLLQPCDKSGASANDVSFVHKAPFEFIAEGCTIVPICISDLYIGLESLFYTYVSLQSSTTNMTISHLSHLRIRLRALQHVMHIFLASCSAFEQHQQYSRLIDLIILLVLFYP